MTTFDNREKGYENKFSHDQEIAFKINARSHKLLGLWAAEKLGIRGEQAEQYAKDAVLADFETDGDSDVIEKLFNDFKHANLSITDQDIRREKDRLLAIARKQILGEK